MANESLYKCFQNWAAKGQIYLYADPHFGDEYVTECRGGMTDEEQIKRINSVVHKHDTLIILGDVGDLECVKRLHGYKVLIKGNHDKGSSVYQRHFTRKITNFDKDVLSIMKKNGEISAYYPGVAPSTYIVEKDNRLFDEIFEGPLFIGPKILLSHEPILGDFMLNIHGHDHGNRSYDYTHVNLCAELIDFTPVSLSSIIKAGTLGNITDLHRQTIDNAKARVAANCVSVEEETVNYSDHF